LMKNDQTEQLYSTYKLSNHFCFERLLYSQKNQLEKKTNVFHFFKYFSAI
jgi:hypothetical protein